MSVKPSRTALVAFFNDTLKLRISKVDDLGNGAAYCQLVDSVFGDLPMQRVRFDTRAPLEMEQNYKILQQAFIRHKVNKNFDATRLMKCRLQDNLDFSQWLYQFWHESSHIEGYDPLSRRADGSNGINTGPNLIKRAPSQMLSTKTSAGPQPKATNNYRTVNSARSTPVQAPEMMYSRTPVRPRLAVSKENFISPSAAQQIAALEAECDELGRSVDVLEQERGLYYNKLLDVETLMNNQIDRFYSKQGDTAAMEHSKDPMLLFIRQIQEILFSSPEGFQPEVKPEDEPF